MVVPSPSDLFGTVLPGTSPDELRDNIESIDELDDAHTGTPPVAGPVGVPAVNVGRVGQFAATALSFGAQNTEIGREWTGAGFEGITDFDPGFDPASNDPTPDPDGGSPWPWWAPLAALVVVLVGVNAFAGGLAEGVTE